MLDNVGRCKDFGFYTLSEKSQKGKNAFNRISLATGLRIITAK